MRLLLWLSALVVCLRAGEAASILDLLLDWGDDGAMVVQQRGTETPSSSGGLRNCSCEGTACNCCVDFNLTFIDLGGPGCVKMKYISPEDGIAVNVSYGENLLHSESVKGANPEPTCMDMLSDLAQLCAHLVDLAPTRDGIRWCLQIEPTLLGEVQAEYHVGCFRMAPEGMLLDPAHNYSQPLPEVSSTETPDDADTTEQVNEEALLAAVSESAEQGIAFFSNLLGLTLGSEAANSSSTPPPDSRPQHAAPTSPPPSSRSHLN